MTKTEEPPKVAILIPSDDEWKAHTAMSMAGLTSTSTLHGVKLAIFSETSSMITRARNSLVSRALASPAEFDFMMFFDSDMLFPPDTILRLLRHDKDIVGATYHQKGRPYRTLGHLVGPARDLSGGGLVEADLMPGGVLLIRASVFKNLEYPWFFETYKWPGDPVPAFIKMLADWSNDLLPLEARSAIAGSKPIVDWLEANADFAAKNFEAGSITSSEDYNFCRKARKAGYQIWCDLDLTSNIGHIGEDIITSQLPPKAEDAKAA